VILGQANKESFEETKRHRRPIGTSVFWLQQENVSNDSQIVPVLTRTPLRRVQTIINLFFTINFLPTTDYISDFPGVF